MCSWAGKGTGRSCQVSVLFSVTSQATGPAWMPAPVPAIFYLISTYLAQGREGAKPKEEKTNKLLDFQVITDWKSQFLCPDGRENKPSSS